jgi:ER membrane protein complex subunit 7
VYLLDVLAIDHIYSQIKILVAANGTIVPVEYKYPGAPRTHARYPLELSPLVKTNYFQVKEGFSLYKTVFKNPMMIMMVVSLAVIVFFPKLLSGMDKDQMKELMEQQKAAGMDGGDPTAALKKMFGMESKNDDDDDE